MRTLPLRSSAAQSRQRVLFNLVGYLECEVRIFGISKRFRIGKPFGKSLPDRLKQRGSKSCVVFEHDTRRAKKLDKQGFKDGRSHESIVQQGGVVVDGCHGDSPVRPELGGGESVSRRLGSVEPTMTASARDFYEAYRRMWRNGPEAAE